MPLDFPSSPTTGQQFTGPNGIFSWDGTKWAPYGVAASLYVPIAGATMTGPLILSANPTAALGAVTKQYVDAATASLGSFVPISGGTMTGTLTAPKLAAASTPSGQSSLTVNQLQTYTGTAPGVAFVGHSQFFGNVTSGGAPNWWTFNVDNDRVNSPSGAVAFEFNSAFGGGSPSVMTGGRDGVNINMTMQGDTPTATGAGAFYTGLSTWLECDYWNGGSPGDERGNNYGLDVLALNRDAGSIGSYGYRALTGIETDLSLYHPAINRIGIWTVEWSTSTTAAWLMDAAFGVATQGNGLTATPPGFDVAYSIGVNNGYWPLQPTGTILGNYATLLQPTGSRAAAAAVGIDFTNIQLNYFGYKQTGAAISGAGDIGGLTVTGTTLTTRDGVQAQTAVVNTITVVKGGEFRSIPALTVSAPAGSGTTATATVATMGLRRAQSIVGNRGTGYAVGNVLTLVGGTFTTTATATVAAVDTNGAIIDFTYTPGSYTVLPANPVAVTGGAGTGAAITTAAWRILTVNVTGAGTNYKPFPPPLVTSDNTTKTLEPMFNVTMTASAATLVLNPSGGAVTVTGAATVTGALNYTATGASTSRSAQDRAAVALNVLDFGAMCDGTTDDTAAVNNAISYICSVGGGILQFPHGTCLMLGAMNIPYTNMGGTGVQPMQRPISLRGVSANYGWNGQSFPQQAGSGTVIDMRYGGGDAFGHVAKIDTRGMGTLEIDSITFIDGGTSNYLFIQTTNTVLKVNNCRFLGNQANNGQTCVQDAIRLGGITSSASGALQTDNPLAGFQGYGSAIENCQFDSIRECVQFGEAANIVVVRNCTVNRNCGSAKAQGAPYYFYGISLGSHGNIISGGFVEMVNYPYAVAMIGAAMNRNIISYLGLYDESMGSPTVGGVYFDTGATFNSVYTGYVDFPLHAAMMMGPSALQNTLVSGGGACLFQNDITSGDQQGNSKIIISGGNTNANDGAQLQFEYGGTVGGIIGNYSAVKGGAYDAHLTIYGGGNGVVVPNDRLAVYVGNGVFPAYTIHAGLGTGSQRLYMNGGNSATADGAAMLFAAAGTTIGAIGNYSAAGFGGAFNQIMTLWGASHGILIPSDKVGIATGAALNPVGAEIGIGDGTGQRRIVLNGGNTNTADGALVLFYNNSARIGGVGNADTYLNTTYGTYNRSTILAGYDGLIFCTHDVEQARVTAPTSGIARWLFGTTTDDGVNILQVNGGTATGALNVRQTLALNTGSAQMLQIGDTVVANSDPFLAYYATGSASGALSAFGLNVYYDAAIAIQRVNTAKNGWMFSHDVRNAVSDGNLLLRVCSSAGSLATAVTFDTAGGITGATLISTTTVQANTQFRQGASGPTWTSGAGAPASTQPVGSIYSNTSGGVGARLYVSAGAGTWAAVAGV